MGIKGVGFFKKLKTLAKSIAQPLSKTFDFVNNLYRRTHKYVDPLIKTLPGGEVVTNALHTASDMADNYYRDKAPVSDRTQKLLDNTTQLVNDAVDVTQNYSSPLDRVKRVNDIVRERSGLSNRYQTSGGDIWDDV